MGIFSLSGFSDAESKALLSDAIALTTYSYHNLDNGLAYGYQHYGFGSGLPLTLIKALVGNTVSQGTLPGLPWNPDSEKAALEKVNAAGWYVISPEALNYQGKTNAQGTYYGETPGYKNNQAEIMGKYDDSGALVQIGIVFRGTSGAREELILDTLGDVWSDLKITFGSEEYVNNYTLNSFGDLLGQVAKYAQEHGLSGSDVVVTGHSLGGGMVNSLAFLSEDNWGGFYSSSAFIAEASPTQYEQTDKVLNMGLENDPVFRALDGSQFTLATLGIHDTSYNSTTDNIVSFNDFYASSYWGLTPFSILNLASWLTHMPFMYEDTLTRILNSEFYSLTERDSTIIVASLSDSYRGSTWVSDLNKAAEKHTGPTFILGSDGDDLISGGSGNDYLEGNAGNDTFRDTGGYNIILGGEGNNTLDLQHALNKSEIAWDGETLYLRDQDGGITLASDITTLRSKESFMCFWHQDKDYQVTSEGLLNGNNITHYADALTGDADNNELTAHSAGSWLFGLDGDDTLTGSDEGYTTFVGAAGNDVLNSRGGHNTFLFSGNFGHDTLYDFDKSDTLVFMAIEGATGGDYLDFLSMDGDNAVFNFGESSVTLVGVSQNIFDDAHVVLA